VRERERESVCAVQKYKAKINSFPKFVSAKTKKELVFGQSFKLNY
jgi:hypothetical protein